MKIPVLDGPFQGIELDYDIAAPASVLLQRDEEGMVARYRYNRQRRGYVFKEWDRVVATVPLPVRGGGS